MKELYQCGHILVTVCGEKKSLNSKNLDFFSEKAVPMWSNFGNGVAVGNGADVLLSIVVKLVKLR